jgi:hypothetical protein
MKHIKIFEQFILESEPYTPHGAQDQMLNILLSMNKRSTKNGKFKLLFNSHILADSYSRLTGLPLYDDDNFVIATSNNKKELQDMKKEFWDSIFPEHKRALKFNGTSLVIESY